MKRNLLAGSALALALAIAGSAAHAQVIGAEPSDSAASDPLVAQTAGPAGDWAGYAHVGYHLDPHWRVELQGGYRPGATSPAALAPGAARGPCADPMSGLACDPRDRALGAYSAVANLVFDAMPDSRWVDPFVGVGVGVSRFDPGPIALTNPAMQLLQMNAGGAAQLGYQAVVGLAFRPRDRLHFDLTYRWLGAAGPAVSAQQAALNSRFQDQTVAISVRYALSIPRTAIAPAPSFSLASSGGAARLTLRANRPHTVVVETPSNPAALSAEAEAAVGQTALSASQGRSSHVVVDGHADTASAADYNRRLSERRAKAMADAMVSLGVPVSSLDLNWSSEEADSPLPPATEAPAPALQARASLTPGR
jgi:outer membrane protein OmpA-like peptidoglycan-associated protein